jgi:peptidyl-prolyl cis-trans isomerase B (cyclophilin B)
MRISLFFILTLVACGEAEIKRNDHEVTVKETKPEEANKIEKQVDVMPLLTNQNCVEVLTQFGKEHPENRIVVETQYGDIHIRLFDDTPLHRASFVNAIQRGAFNPTEFLRVIKGFVIQGGNSESFMAAQKRDAIGKYTIPSEISTRHLHFPGALAMSRMYENNPEKRSSAFDFYIVDGKKVNSPELAQIEVDHDWKYTPEQRQAYLKRGGAPHLDGDHTVFGEVIQGMEIVHKIASVETDEADWPRMTESIVIRLSEENEK